MPDRIAKIEFPLAGLNRAVGRQSQPPYSTPESQNVMPRTTLEDRARGGSRPGLGLAYMNAGAGPVRLLNPVGTLDITGFQVWDDPFDGYSLGNEWEKPAGMSSVFTESPAVVREGLIGYNLNGSVAAGAMLIATDFPIIDLYSTAAVFPAYQASILIAPYQGSHCGTYYIFFGATTSGSITDYRFLQFTINGSTGVWSAAMRKFITPGGLSTIATNAGATDGYCDAGWLTVDVYGASATTSAQVIARWRADEIFNNASAYAPAAGNYRVGFGMLPSSGRCQIDTFRLRRFNGYQNSITNVVAASSSGTWLRDDHFGGLDTNAGAGASSDHNVQAAERLQVLYAADWEETRAYAAGGASDALVTYAATPVWRLSATSIGNKFGGSTYGFNGTNQLKIDSQRDLLWIVAVAGNESHVACGYYAFNATGVTDSNVNITGRVDGQSLASTLGTTVGTTLDQVKFRIECAPKTYTPNGTSASTVAIWSITNTQDGVVPLGCKLIARYGDRMILGAPGYAPHAWYMSRDGDPYDFDYGADPYDEARAISGAAEPGAVLNDSLTALIPTTFDYFIFGMSHSMAVMRGNIAAGGRIDYLTREVGPVSAQAWAQGPDGEIVTLTRKGIYVIPPGAGGVAPLSDIVIPRDLIGIDGTLTDVFMAYSRKERGFYIFQSGTKQVGKRRHWFLDWQNKSFWPLLLQDGHEPTSLCVYEGQTAEESCVLLGCRDGYVRRFHRLYETDNGTAITNYVLLGPLQFGGDYEDGIIKELDITLDPDSGPVTWGLYTGETAKEAVDAAIASSPTPLWTGTATGGTNYKVHPRTRDYNIILKLSGSGTRSWSLEDIIAVVGPAGKSRKL